MRRGEIRWYTFQVPDKWRPVLVLTRNEVIDADGGLAAGAILAEPVGEPAPRWAWPVGDLVCGKRYNGALDGKPRSQLWKILSHVQLGGR